VNLFNFNMTLLFELCDGPVNMALASVNRMKRSVNEVLKLITPQLKVLK